MDYIDITIPLSEKTPVFPGDPEVRFEIIRKEGYNITSLCLSSHSGTHLDAPSHYMEGGLNVDEIPLESINGDSVVIDIVPVKGYIEKEDIKENADGSGIIILKTGFPSKPSDMTSYKSLSSECAKYLADCGITCVVTDAPSIEAYDGEGTVHRILLENNISIIEMAGLSGVCPGRYRMNALPLRLEGCDGAPVRALLYYKRGEEK